MSINKIFSTAVMISILSACSAANQNEWFVNHAGNMPAQERVARLAVGDSKEDVVNVLGMPSSLNVFDDNSWIYMSSDIKKLAFFAPEEIDRSILHITFNNDKINNIEVLSLAEGKKLTPDSDKTDVKGQKPGFFRKYFGGVGQYTPFGNSGPKM